MASPRVLPVAVFVVAVTACGGGDSVTVEDAWARASAAGQTSGAVYFDITVDDEDVLVGASVSPDVAGRAEIHEVVPAETEMSETEMSEMGDGTDESSDMSGMDGAMTMREVEGGLVLTGGETVSFEPGSYHLMLFDLAAPLVAGDQIEVTLEFAEAGSTTIGVDVAETAP